MRRIIWPAVTLTLMSAAFGAGRMTDGFRTLPAIVLTLPGEEAGFSRELDARIRERFPIGTSEDKLIGFLASEKFVPDWRRGDAANSSSFIENGLICKKGHCQSKFYTDCLRIRAGQSSTVFAHESPTRSAGFDAENGLYLFALTVPSRRRWG